MGGIFKSENGSVAPFFAVSIAAIIGVIATTIALASDSRAANEIQHTADSAAIAGATTFATLDTPKAAERLQQALQAAEDYAVANSSYTLVEIDLGAVVEDPYSQRTTIDVELEFQPANVMARVAGRSGNIAIRRRARAESVWGFPLCALSLSTGGIGIGSSDSSRLDTNNCLVWSNSAAHDSMSFRGGPSNARGYCAAGNVVGKHLATPLPEEACDAIPDPLADWSPPTPGTCLTIPEREELLAVETWSQGDKISRLGVLQNTLEVLEPANPIDTTPIKTAIQNDEPLPIALAGEVADILQRAEDDGQLVSAGKGNDEIGADGRYTKGAAQGYAPIDIAHHIGILDHAGKASYASDPYVGAPTLTLLPNTYCGLDIHRGHVKLEPGIYFIKDAPLTVRRRATLTGEGVTIVMSGENASFNIINEARLTLTAPETGDTAGFALVEDKNAEFDSNSIVRSRLAGDGIVNAIGTIYLPRHSFEISGNGSGQQASPLLQIVAHAITLSENGELKIDFDPTQTQVPVGIKPARSARIVG